MKQNKPTPDDNNGITEKPFGAGRPTPDGKKETPHNQIMESSEDSEMFDVEE